MRLSPSTVLTPIIWLPRSVRPTPRRGIGHSTLPADSGIPNTNSEFSSCDPYSRVHPAFAVGSWQRFAADQGPAPGSDIPESAGRVDVDWCRELVAARARRVLAEGSPVECARPNWPDAPPPRHGISNPNSEFSSCDPYSRVHSAFAVGSWQRFAADQGSAPGSTDSSTKTFRTRNMYSTARGHISVECASMGSVPVDQPSCKSACRKPMRLSESIFRGGSLCTTLWKMSLIIRQYAPSKTASRTEN